jgi:hypothetical protein
MPKPTCTFSDCRKCAYYNHPGCAPMFCHLHKSKGMKNVSYRIPQPKPSIFLQLMAHGMQF